MADINNDGLLDYMASDMAGSNHYTEKMSMGNMTGQDSDSWFLNWPRPRAIHAKRGLSEHWDQEGSMRWHF